MTAHTHTSEEGTCFRMCEKCHCAIDPENRFCAECAKPENSGMQLCVRCGCGVRAGSALCHECAENPSSIKGAPASNRGGLEGSAPARVGVVPTVVLESPRSGKSLNPPPTSEDWMRVAGMFAAAATRWRKRAEEEDKNFCEGEAKRCDLAGKIAMFQGVEGIGK